MKIIDLSVSLDESTKVQGESTGYTDPPVRFEPWLELEHKYRVTKIEMGAHAGTHVDVPCHMFADGKSTSDYPVDYWVGWAVIMDFRGKGPISVEMVLPYKSKIALRRYTIAVLRNGVTDYFTSAAREVFLSWHPQAVIMGEGINIDERYEDSMSFLRADVPMIMNANHQMIADVKDNDLIIAAPLKVTGLEAAPIRLIAIKGVTSMEAESRPPGALTQDPDHERIAELERMVGRLMVELEATRKTARS